MGITLGKVFWVFAVSLKTVAISFSSSTLGLPMCGNGVAGISVFKTLIGLVAALVAATVEDINGIFVCCGKNSTLMIRRSPCLLGK